MQQCMAVRNAACDHAFIAMMFKINSGNRTTNVNICNVSTSTWFLNAYVSSKLLLTKSFHGSLSAIRHLCFRVLGHCDDEQLKPV